ncbi:MAG: hypothetical protein NZ583_00715 [Desulfobacterota bacterium]|nr:hypothetical protein [Thermodesulfobacteriota bacterium]MDW8001236.1 hypothetical protein [Deltaproteobacteria bacterium]
MLGEIVEVFIYSALYVFILTVGAKIIFAAFSLEFEKRIAPNGSIGLSIIISSFFIGVALIFIALAR